LEVKLINQQIKEEESKQKVARLLKRNIFILKRWEAVKEYLDFRVKQIDNYKWKEETVEVNTWGNYMNREVEKN
jgi:hypothetical protein